MTQVLLRTRDGLEATIKIPDEFHPFNNIVRYINACPAGPFREYRHEGEFKYGMRVWVEQPGT